MKKLYPLFGIITVLNTPFGPDGGVEVLAVRKHVQLALAAGVKGFLVPGMAAEVQKLTLEERLQLVRVVLDEVQGQVPVFAGAGEADQDRQLQIVKRYLEMGCKEVLLQLPYKDDLQFIDRFQRMADLGPEVLMLQDWDPQGYGLPEHLILELFERVEAFRCLKVETVPAGVKYSRLLHQTGGRLHLSGGWAVMQMLEALKRGVHAFMPTGMHHIYTRIYYLFQTGQEEEAERLFQQILPVLAFSNQYLDLSVHFFKQLLHRQGVFSTPHVRTPILPFDAVHEEMARVLIDRVIRLEEELKRQHLQAYC
jgi:dihydrodipicolinate synthase/N-acetylneuraminate lyase